MRIVVDWCHGPYRFCNGCAHHHEKTAAKAAIEAGSVVYKRFSMKGAALILFDGGATDQRLAKARRMREAAVQKLVALGYHVKMQNDEGGTELFQPEQRWVPAPECNFHHEYDRPPYFNQLPGMSRYPY